MHFTLLTLLTTALAISQQVSAAATLERRDDAKCYSGGGKWGNEDQKAEARTKARECCNEIGTVIVPTNTQLKRCVDYSNGKIQFRIKNGFGHDQTLNPVNCSVALNLFVYLCERGGYDDTSKGWRGRADPGEGCDP
ncbi:hypothetical protein AJ79_04131 [Helicocarpus griseus UAMH5409]|uniref:Ecp2 effector protein domain-containing protein n=1 Tax=Helicocarpus griseus UAMH5409 TaxID=1447875 RepID=A0A2B7XV36_9EURO|nr:hypothetical protein AJ79_04131 [Helicocarpus griseus UAMH5409]